MKRLSVLLILFFVSVQIISAFAAESVSIRTIVEIEIPEKENMSRGEELAYMELKNSQETPIWSPDGKYIAFTSRIGIGIWIVPVEGGMPKLVHENYHEYTYDGTLYAFYGILKPLKFSADGREIYFHDWSLDADSHTVIKVYGGGEGAACNNPKIKAVNIDTGEVRILVEKAGVGYFSNDDRYCVYRQLGSNYRSWLGIYMKDLVTGETRSVAPGGKEACLTADDTHVIYTVWQDGMSQLYRKPLAGGESERITNFTKSDICYQPVFPQCSPDGKWLMFVASYRDWWDESGWYVRIDENGNEVPRKVNYCGICAMNLETGEVSRLCPDTKFLIRDCPRFSPDGSKIIYRGARYYPENTDGFSDFLSEIHILDFVPMSFAKPTAVDEAVPVEIALIGNYPNPFNPSTTIEFSMPESGNVNLTIYNTTGQKVRELVSGHLSQGVHSAVWDGRDESGNPVSSGVYISRLMSGNKVQAKRMVLLR